jgi:hypothetical protein
MANETLYAILSESRKEGIIVTEKRYNEHYKRKGYVIVGPLPFVGGEDVQEIVFRQEAATKEARDVL